jgi:hypothetical protein
VKDVFEQGKRMVVSFTLHRRSRVRVLQWVRDEWARYSTDKYDDDRDRQDGIMRREGCDAGSWWNEEVMRYVHRAHILGLDTPLGRQAVMKGAAVYLDMCASIIRVHGDPPPGGRPSGEL